MISTGELRKMTRLTPKVIRIVKTCNLYLNFLVMGMCGAVTGPTLLDLQNLVKTDIQHVVVIYTARSIGYLCGSIAGGIIFDMLTKKQIVLTVVNFFVAVTMFAIPWSRSILILTMLMVGNGISMGILDTGGNVCCLNLWDSVSAPFYQALHFAFAFGGLIAPLIAAPFLETFDGTSFGTNNTNSTFLNSTLKDDLEASILENSVATDSHIPTVTYAYTIIGCIALFVTVLFLIMCIIAPIDENKPNKEEAQTEKQSITFILTIIGFTISLIFVSMGTEIGYAQMLTTYAVKGSLKLSSTVGSYMTSVFFTAFAISRFFSVFLAIKLNNLQLLILDVIVSLIGSLVLLFLGATTEWALWFSTVILGIGAASIYPAAVGWVYNYIAVTNIRTASIAVGSAFGEMVIPYIISFYIEEVPEVLLYIVPVSCALSAFILLVMYLLLRNKESRFVKDEGIAMATVNENVVS